MNDANTPVAWANEDDDGIYEVGLYESDARYSLERAQSGKFADKKPRVVPLYRSPTLTEEEREAIACGIDAIRDRLEGYDECEPLQATLRRLLKRLG